MSTGFVRKILCQDDDEGVTPDAAHNSPLPAPAPAPMNDSEVPVIVRKFARVLKQQNMTRDTSIGRVMLRASLQVLASDVRRGQIGYVQSMELLVDEGAGGKAAPTPEQWWQRINDTNCSLPHALSVILVSYDAQQMPFDTQISLRGFETEFERRLGERVPCDSSLRDHILFGERSVPRGDKPFTLLTRPLVCEEILTGITFASVEAVGFNSNSFWRFTARRVPEKKVPGVARLFTRQNAAAGDLHGSDSGLGKAGFYYVPLTYRHTSLVARVHVYLTLQRLRRESVYELEIDSIDPSSYELPTTSQYLIFEASALNAAVRFIDEKLVDVHPTFHPRLLRATLEPVQHDSWTEAWQARENKARALDAVSLAHGEQHRRITYVGEDKALRCEATFIVYYVVFRQTPLSNLETPSDDDETSAAQPTTNGHRKDPYLGDVADTDSASTLDDNNATMPSTANTLTQPVAKATAQTSGDSNDYGTWKDMLPTDALAPAPWIPIMAKPDDDAPIQAGASESNSKLRRTISVTTGSCDDEEDGEDDEMVYKKPPPKVATRPPPPPPEAHQRAGETMGSEDMQMGDGKSVFATEVL